MKLIEFILLISIALSPFLLFNIIGGLLYLYFTGWIGISLWIGIGMLGVYFGIRIAKNVKQKGNASDFIGLIRRNPEMDNDENIKRFSN